MQPGPRPPLSESAAATAPILVTGAPRSGSTWVGNILALDRGAAYIHEPFNKNCPPGRCRARFQTAFTYVTDENEAPYLEALRDTIGWKYSLGAELSALRTPRQAARMTRDFLYFEANRRAGRRVILKDPLAIFSADWLARRFGARVVVVIRHPAAFVASLRAARWSKVRFEIFGGQALLMRDRLGPFEAEIRAAMAAPPDEIGSGILLWNLLHHHMTRLRADHPDWIFVRHEDLSRAPEEAYAALFSQLGLAFTESVRRDLAGYTTQGGGLRRFSLFGTRRRTVRDSKGNIFAFRARLSPEELARIRAETAEIADLYYGPADW